MTIGQKIFVILSLFVVHKFSIVHTVTCPSSDWIAPSGYGMPIPGCIYINPDKNVTYSWGYAQSLCKNTDLRSYLPFFADITQIKTFQGMAPLMQAKVGKIVVWLGGYKSTLRTWNYLDRSSMANGSDGGWMTGQPNGTTAVPERCLAFNIADSDNGFSDWPCTRSFSYGCYLPDPTQTIKSPSNIKPSTVGLSKPAMPCPTNWVPAGGYCYQAITTPPNTKVTLASKCAALDPRATLPRFFTSSDYDKMIKMVSDTLPAGDHANFYVDGERIVGSTTFSYDGKTPLVFTNWYIAQPAAAGSCIMYSDLDGYKWNVTTCSANLNVMCQLNTSAPMPSVPTTSTTSTTTTTTTTKPTTTTTTSTTTTTPTTTTTIPSTLPPTTTTTIKPTTTTPLQTTTTTATVTIPTIAATTPKPSSTLSPTTAAAVSPSMGATLTNAVTNEITSSTSSVAANGITSQQTASNVTTNNITVIANQVVTKIDTVVQSGQTTSTTMASTTLSQTSRSSTNSVPIGTPAQVDTQSSDTSTSVATAPIQPPNTTPVPTLATQPPIGTPAPTVATAAPTTTIQAGVTQAPVVPAPQPDDAATAAPIAATDAAVVAPDAKPTDAANGGSGGGTSVANTDPSVKSVGGQDKPKKLAPDITRATLVIPYNWHWEPPLWFYILLVVLVALPVLLWGGAFCYRAIPSQNHHQQPMHHHESWQEEVHQY